MYTLTFKKSKSRKFQQALNHAVTLGATWDQEGLRLEIPESDLVYMYPEMINLSKLVENMTSTKATFRGW